MLMLICGLPGTGKSTLARELSAALGAEYVSSDLVRRRMFEERTYSEKEKYKVYNRMVSEAERLLLEGKDVICDSTFYKRRTRKEMLLAAKRAGVRAVIVLCRLEGRLVEERIEERERNGEDPSEAGFGIYLKVKSLFEPIDEEHIEVDTSLPIEEQVAIVRGGAAESGSGGWKPDELVSLGMELEETHISWVFLSGGHAYKIKKPVKFSFLDFSSLGKRQECCEEEVRLNRRLCPDIYLGVVPLARQAGGGIGFGGEGEVLDYAVKMRRIGEKRMDELLRTGAVTQEKVEEIARIVEGFHRSVPAIQDPLYNSPEQVMGQVGDLGSVRETFGTALPLAEKIDFVLEKSGEFIAKNDKLMRGRQAEGRVKDCHGDLHSANVFLGEKIQIFDCIEYNEEFRFIDVASEIAFMAMDLDAHGREELSEAFVSEYVLRSGDGGTAGKLLDFYKCYRANVRAKVAALGYSQHRGEEEKRNMERYLMLAETYASRL